MAKTSNILPAEEGEMIKLTKNKSWAETPLGPRENWPLTLRTFVKTMLATNHPAFIFWGEDHICFYNDAYSVSLGPEKHPDMLGQPGRKFFSEIWDIIGPQIELVLAGEGSTWHENHLVPTFRGGKLDEVYWTYSYSPIFSAEDNSIEGVLVLCNETTEAVKAERDLRESEKRHQIALETGKLGAWQLDLEENKLSASAVCKSIFGLTTETDLAYTQLKNMIHPEDIGKWNEAVRKSVGDQEEFELEFRIYWPNGEEHWVSVRGQPFPASDGNPDRTIGVAQNITGRKRNEQLQYEQSELLELIATSSPLDTCLTSLCKVVPRLYTNSRASVVLADAERKKINKVLSPDYPQSFNEKMEGASVNKRNTPCGEVIYSGEPVTTTNLAEDERWSSDWRNQCLSNGIKACHSEPIYDEKGRCVGSFMLCFNEIREPSDWELRLSDFGTHIASIALAREHSQQVILESEDRYRMLFESIDEGFCIIEKVDTAPGEPIDFRYVVTNPAFNAQSGIDNAEGKTIRDLLPDIGEIWIETYNDVVEKQKSIHFEAYLEVVDRNLQLHAFPTGQPEEQKVGVLFLDVTEQKQIEANLRKSGERLQAALEGTGVGIWDFDLTNGSVWRSHKHDQLFGYTEPADEWSYEKFMNHIVNDDREKVEQRINDAIEGDGKLEVECRINRIDDVQRWISIRGQAIKNDEDQDSANRIVGIVHDVTHRKEDEEKLEALNETLEERVEQRTAALLSYQEQLRSLASQLSKAEESERHRLAADLHDNLGQLLAMCKMELDLIEGKRSEESDFDQVNYLLSEAISYTRKLMSDLKPPPTLDKEDIVESVEWVAQKMEKQGLEVSVTKDKKPKPLSKEMQTTLLQSVREALFNVVKHAGVKNTQIHISREKQQVRISIQDKGKGFNSKKHKPAVTDEGGFGLFNIQERMDLMGGKFEISSEEGKGTTVDLYAPLLKEEESEALERQNGAAKKSKIDLRQPDKIRVLLVDDHKMMLKGLRRIIEQEDDLMVIDEAMNGEEAVKLARENPPDVIVMDVDMPVMDGIDATREIVSSIENVRIIGLSLHEKGSVAQAMRNAGASAYLTKTEAFEALCATIRSEAVLAKK